MSAIKTGFAALAILAGLTASAHAQGVSRGTPTGGFVPYPGPGSDGDYYSISPGFGTYGLPGNAPDYNGHALSGYGPGASLNAYFKAAPKAEATPKPKAKPPQVYNNPVGVKSGTQKQPVKSARYGSLSGKPAAPIRSGR